MIPRFDQYSSIWSAAKASELGVVIPCLVPTEAHSHLAKLYETRTALADPDLAPFSLFVPADGTKILLIRKLNDALP